MSKQLEIELLLNDKQALSRLNTALGQIESRSRTAAAATTSGWTEVAAQFYLVQQAIGPVIGFMANAVRAAAEEEAALNKLSGALQNQGTYTAEIAQRYQEMAESFQSSSRFADDAILRVQQRLVSVGNVAPAEMQRVTQAVIDFSAATGTDLQASANLFAKAAAGKTEALERYGIILDESIPKTQRFEAALRMTEQRFGGSAIKELDTYAGATKKLANTWDNFLEEMGRFITENPKVRDGIGIITASVDKLTEALKKNKEAAADAMGSGVMAGLPGMGMSIGQSMLANTKGTDALMGGPSGMVAGLFGKGDNMLDQMMGSGEALAATESEEQAMNDLKLLKRTELYQAELEAETAHRQMLNELGMLSVQERIDMERQQITAWQDEKSAQVMANLQKESEFTAFALDVQKKAHESMWPTITKLRDQFSAGMSKMLTDAITGTANWGEAFKAMGKQMIATLIEYGVQMAVNAAIGKALQAAGLAATIPIAKATASAWAPAAAMVSIATFGTASAAGAAALTATVGLAKGLAMLPGLAEGGTINSAGTVLVGERGPEFLDLPAGARVRPLDHDGGSGGTNLTLVINNPVFAPGDLSDQIVQMVGPALSAWFDNERRRL